jgi:hypothetical protein
VSLTDAQWLAWLKQTDKNPTAAIQVNYEDDGGTPGTLYISNFGYIDPFDVDGNNYRAVIVNDVKIRQDEKISIMESIDIKVADTNLFDYYFIGQSLTIYYGDKSWPFSDFRQIYTGKIADFTRSPNDYATIVMDSNLLQTWLRQTVDIKAVDFEPYESVDYPCGIGSNCFNINPIRISSTVYRIYWFDPNIYTLVVRKNGVTQTLTTHYTRALYTGTGGEYSGVTITFVSAPSTTDLITVDLSGWSYATASSAFNIVGNTVARIVPTAIPNSFTSAYVNSDIGYVWYQPEPFSKFANLVLASAGGKARLNASGEIEPWCNPQAFAPVSRTLTSSELLQGSLRIADKSQPWRKHTLGWLKNFYPQTSGLSSSVSESNARLYAQSYSYDILSSSTRDEYPNALSVETQTVITDFYDMVFVSEKLYGYDGGERTDVEYQVLYTGIYDDIGDSVNITTNELGLSAGEIYTVVRNNLNLNTGVCTQRGRT